MHFPRARSLRILSAVLVVLALGPSPSTRVDAAASALSKLDPLLQQQGGLLGRSRVILRVTNAGAVGSVLSLVQLLGGRLLRRLPIIDGLVLDLPNVALPIVAGSPLVVRMSLDRLVVGSMERTGATTGAAAVRQQLGFDGSGVGIAVIDSGVAPSHDDLMDSAAGAQRVDRFVDLNAGRTAAYDDYGHGTHVAGIIAGNGFDSGGARSGIAPGAHLIVLKVLDRDGQGRISDVIAALDYVVTNQTALNIRIVNLSVATGVYESYHTDPLTLAARQAVTAGIVVVAAAGNAGRGSSGSTQYGGITAPGNAPWVLTVGASSHMGTADRADDTIAAFGSRGPSAIDHGAKPDLVAPGVGIESLTDPASRLYLVNSPYLLNGTVPTAYLPYMSLSGTSMSAPVVTGTVALMLQAHPSLTPNAVKAILQYTAQIYSGYDTLTQGAGFLNAKGAVELAAHLTAPATLPYPDDSTWSRQIIWANHATRGGTFTADATAWSLAVTWGDAATANGLPVRWGNKNGGPWQTTELPLTRNVVWGTLCDGLDCLRPWNAAIMSATGDGEGETVVWGTDGGEQETVVWGTSGDEGETVVWGTSCGDPSCTPVVWNGQ
jgi:serine protease AprX